jgi:SAM-dependent methyltransferase
MQPDKDVNKYWEERFLAEGKIWGDKPSRSAAHALEFFRRHGAKTLLVPGSGYGRNTRLFSGAGLAVTGVEIASAACGMAGEFDKLTRFYSASAMDMSFLAETFDAVYCFNTLHLFLENDRKTLVGQCADRLNKGGIMYFTVFSEREESYGKGREVEKDTYESKPGRPAHYFTDTDLRGHFPDMEIIETGLTEDPEDHGEGPHTHVLRYICTRINR